jgi:peptidoglycan/LPS O-acetylase OafA/YrhL
VQDRREIRSHTAIRGIAALLVVAYHLQYSANLLPFETATTFFRRSYLFVDLFFILSGFVISYVNIADEARPFNAEQTRRFIIKRLMRLYPLVLFCLGYLFVFRVGLSAIYLMFSHAPPFAWDGRSWTILLTQLTLTNAWLPDPDDWNVPSWSISAEMFAYAMFPILLWCRAMRPVVTACICAAVILGFYQGAARHGTLDIIGGWAPLRCLAGFMLGMALYLGRMQIDRLTSPVLSLFQIASVIGVVACLTLPVSDIVVIPAFVLLVGMTWRDRGILPRLIDGRIFNYLGRLSYSIYLNHVALAAIVGTVWSRVAKRFGITGDLEAGLWILILYTVVVLVSHFTYHRIELVAQRKLTDRFLRRAPQK